VDCVWVVDSRRRQSAPGLLLHSHQQRAQALRILRRTDLTRPAPGLGDLARARTKLLHALVDLIAQPLDPLPN